MYLNHPLVHKNVYHHLSARFVKRCSFEVLQTKCVRITLANPNDPHDANSMGSKAHLFSTPLRSQPVIGQQDLTATNRIKCVCVYVCV